LTYEIEFTDYLLQEKDVGVLRKVRVDGETEKFKYLRRRDAKSGTSGLLSHD